MKELMQIGDIVDVYWPNGDRLEDVEVKNIPQATGDSWVFEQTIFNGGVDSGTRWFVSEGITIQRHPSAQKDKT